MNTPSRPDVSTIEFVPKFSGDKSCGDAGRRVSR